MSGKRYPEEFKIEAVNRLLIAVILMPEQAELSRNDYLALISRLENADTDTAKGDRPAQVWNGVDWPSLIAEMKAMKSLAPIPGVSGLKPGLLNCSEPLGFPPVRHSVIRVNRLTSVRPVKTVRPGRLHVMAQNL